MSEIDIGDHVHHSPSNEDWIVARVDKDYNDLYPAGWPCSRAQISDCVLIKKASKEKRTEFIKEIADSNNGNDPRVSNARYLIKTENIV